MAGPVTYALVKRFNCDDFIYGMGFNFRSYEYYCTNASTRVQFILMCNGLLLTAGYFVWNLGYRQGRTGQSIGKSLLGFRCIGEKTWQPVGFARSLGRQAAHYVDYSFFLVGYLLPLWDTKRQTFADKIMGTVCVPAEHARATSTATIEPQPDRRRKVAAPALTVAGVVTLFLATCGALVVVGNSAGPSINTAARTGGIGEPVRDGNFQFVVVDYGKLSQQNESAVVAVLVVTNTGAQQQQFLAPDQYLVDTTGHNYPAQDIGVSLSHQQPTTALDVKPGSLRIGIHFHIPRGARINGIELHDSPSSIGATIRLH